MGLIDLQPETVFAGDFRIVRPIGRGGFGAVYEAVQLSTGRSRALKVMLPQLVADAKALERFLQESHVTGRIESEHVVQVVTAGVDRATGTPWIALELLRGETLDERMKRAGAMRPLEALEVLRQVCHAVGAAHRVGVVHRDLKPENIFLVAAEREGAAARVKVLDFGIAKVLDLARTSAQATGALGSPRWMAPEQLEAGLMRPATDVWALGLIAFYLLTGVMYWEAAAQGRPGNAMMFELLTSTLVPASERAEKLGAGGRVPKGFDAWFARCVCRDPAGRFRDASEGLEALVTAMTGLDARAFALGDTVAAAAGGAVAAGAVGSSGTSLAMAATMLPAQPAAGVSATVPGAAPQPVLGAAGGPSWATPERAPALANAAGAGGLATGWLVAAAIGALVVFAGFAAAGAWAFREVTGDERDGVGVIEDSPVANGCGMVPVSLNALTAEGELRLSNETQTANGTEAAARGAEMSGDAAGAQHAREMTQRMRAQIAAQLRRRAEDYERWAREHGGCGDAAVYEAQNRAARLRALSQSYGG